ncbi:AAA family ATPase [Dactylosporangium darangshiense]|uniref:AAA family ATPase n=1 Tax=Dactylosporangium darangshiense TaxID=579108 RepID=UPI003639FD72
MGQRRISDLVGRSAELQLIDSLLDRLGGAGVLLRGEPGVGRTALLDAAAARAADRGLRVLRASGAPFETGIGFSALHQLLDPLREQVDRLAGEHRDALDEVLQLTPLPSDNPPLITAVLALLRAAAADRPLLVIADDLQWFDRASATVLGFAARRVGGEPLAFLAAERTLAGSFLEGVRDDVRLAEREIEPLAPEPAATLLDARHPDVTPPVRRRLLAEAAGNPLALVELPAGLSDRQRRGQDPCPSSCP